MKALLFVAAFTLTACAYQPAQPPSLYHQLGEMEGITAIVDNLLFEIAEDDRIIDLFANTDIDRFHEKLIEQLCNVSGGPCEYTGDSMADSHAGLGISHGQFNNLVEDLIAAMESEDVPTSAQNGLLALLAPMYQEIMENQ